MFCQKCGAPIQPNERFCTKCGAPNNQQAQPGFQPQPGYAPYGAKSASNFGIANILRFAAAFFFLLEYLFFFIKAKSLSMAVISSTIWTVFTAIAFAVAAAALVLKALNFKLSLFDFDKIAYGVAAWMLYQAFTLTAGARLTATPVLYIVFLIIIIGLLVAIGVVDKQKKK